MHHHPGVVAWFTRGRRFGGCHNEEASCAPHGGGGWGSGDRGDLGDAGGGSFGVRRPLRFLANKLDLDDKQVAELAKILSDLKTERAQAAVDDRRATTALADAVAGADFDRAAAEGAADRRVEGARRLRDAVVGALGRIHAVLRPEQRERLAYLIRTGALQI